MIEHYRVSIPLEATVRDGIETSFTHKLKNGITLNDKIHVRVEDPTTYLDLEVEAEHRNAAITTALGLAWRFVQLISLVLNKGFEVSLAGIQAIPIEPDTLAPEILEEEGLVHLIVRERLYISDHFRVTEHISSLEPIIPLWERLSQSDSAVAAGLEWLYLGNIVSNESMAFLAYWLAFELLLEQAAKSEESMTVLKKYISTKKEKDALKKELSEVFRKYINDDIAVTRLINYIEQAKVESDVNRWTSILQKEGLDVALDEVRELRKMRGTIVHQNGKDNAQVPSLQLKEIVVSYLKQLLYTDEN